MVSPFSFFSHNPSFFIFFPATILPPPPPPLFFFFLFSLFFLFLSLSFTLLDYTPLRRTCNIWFEIQIFLVRHAVLQPNLRICLPLITLLAPPPLTTGGHVQVLAGEPSVTVYRFLQYNFSLRLATHQSTPTDPSLLHHRVYSVLYYA